MTSVNAVAGDRSWLELHGESPGASAAEDQRIATHLAWIERRLRAASTRELASDARARRLVLLDVLGDYIAEGTFPRNEGGKGGRAPRWVDATGRHCAVAHLVRASGRVDLVDAVQRDHETDYVADMQVPALASWAMEHGFTVQELALVQPTYDDGGSVHVPSEREERMERERRELENRVPRLLTERQVREVVDRYAADALLACGRDHVGHWQVESELRVERDLRVRANVTVTEIASEARVPALERCLRRSAEQRMTSVIRSANHRVRAPITAIHRETLDIYSPSEIEAALESDARPWRGEETRTSALAQCVGDAPRRVLVRVRGGNGEVLVRWDAMPATPMTMEEPERTRWYCIQSVLNYGHLRERGVRDHDLAIEIARDGTIAIVP
jgi:hypothetical protein